MAPNKLHQQISEKLNIEYNKDSGDCKYAIDRFSLETVLEYLKKDQKVMK